ncbi:MAG: thiamine phosphate synthase [Akkermansiaceae bacterium]|nr:thiamine phosphate synthase [Akkermansiaceae bacterium]MCP5551356.1 thiamine phosphate synthase [Akkermansiaceae bacterium]
MIPREASGARPDFSQARNLFRHPVNPAKIRLSNARLYGILDLGYVSTEGAVSMGERMIEGGIDVLQLRAKDHAPETLTGLGREILARCRDAGVPFVINDHPALTAEIGADGVHVGQEDAAMAEVRSLVGDGAIVGRSTHSLEQARAAAKEAPDYIGFGPLFATPTKPEYRPIGTEDIRTVHAELSASLPIFCIGGIKLENLTEVIAAGAERVVIVSGILQAPDVAEYVRKAKRLLEG